MVKFSKYNINKITDSEIIIFNTITSGILLLDEPELIESYKKSVATNNPRLLPKALYDNMLKANMILTENSNELSFLDIMIKTQIFQNRKLMLTIAPTLDCNFACPYCYENNFTCTTTDIGATSKTIKFIDNFMEDYTELIIAWYGGEPLLKINEIEAISNHLIKCNYRFASSIVTNGYLLNKENALKLKKSRVDYVQVTIDGPPEIHNRRRYLKNGRPTFDTIIKNIQDVCDILKICIRINVDNTNVSTLGRLFDKLDEYGLNGKICVYIAPVQDINGCCKGNICLTNKDFSKIQMKYYKEFKHRGYFEFSVPKCDLSLCGAVNISSYVIDPKGNLYKCWNDIGNSEEIIGNIEKGININDKYLKWLEYTPLYHEKCKECSILPLCLGGCPSFFMKKAEPDCLYLKHCIDDFLELIKENSQRA